LYFPAPVAANSMKARRFFLALAFCTALAAISACDFLGSAPCLRGEGGLTSASKDLPSFTGIDVRLPGKVAVAFGPTHQISIETHESLQPEIVVEVVGDDLVIRSESCLEYSAEEANFHITLPDLQNLELKSSAQVDVVGNGFTQNLRLILSGSGAIYYSGTTAKLSVLHSGSGDVVLVGAGQHLETTLSGSGRIKGFGFSSDTAKIVLAGSGYQQVWVKEALEAIITGSGNIYYSGSPQIDKYTPGSGLLIKSN